MPELPEVETMRRGIAAIVGGTVVGAERTACHLKPIAISPDLPTFRSNTLGRRAEGVERLGKRVLVRLDDGAAIVFEPRMTGLLLLQDPPDRQHLRFRLTLTGAAASQLCYWDRRGLGSITLMLPGECPARWDSSRLGPDPLQIDARQLQARLARSRRAIKVALLDQRALAGIGNLYASEILNVARIHPECRCDRLTDDQWHRLHAAMHQVLDEAIRHEGSTLADGTYRNARNTPGGYQQHHRVYARAQQLCRTCGQGVVQRLVQAQRSTFFCPSCQPVAM